MYGSRANDCQTRLYIGCLSADTRDTDLQIKFQRFGRLRDVDVKRGFAFVEYYNHGDAELARRKMNGCFLHGSNLSVEFAKKELRRAIRRGESHEEMRRVEGGVHRNHYYERSDHYYERGSTCWDVRRGLKRTRGSLNNPDPQSFFINREMGYGGHPNYVQSSCSPPFRRGRFLVHDYNRREVCYNCGREGHFARECKEGDWRNKCYACGQTGHIRSQCSNAARYCSVAPENGYHSRSQSPQICARRRKPENYRRNRDPSPPPYKRRNREDRSPSPLENRIYRSPSPENYRRNQDPSPPPYKRRNREDRSPSPLENRIYRSPSPENYRRNQDPSPPPYKRRNREDRSPSPLENRIYRSPSPVRNRIYRSPSPVRSRGYRSPSPVGSRAYRSPSPGYRGYRKRFQSPPYSHSASPHPRKFGNANNSHSKAQAYDCSHSPLTEDPAEELTAGMHKDGEIILHDRKMDDDDSPAIADPYTTSNNREDRKEGDQNQTNPHGTSSSNRGEDSTSYGHVEGGGDGSTKSSPATNYVQVEGGGEGSTKSSPSTDYGHVEGGGDGGAKSSFSTDYGRTKSSPATNYGQIEGGGDGSTKSSPATNYGHVEGGGDGGTKSSPATDYGHIEGGGDRGTKISPATDYSHVEGGDDRGTKISPATDYRNVEGGGDGGTKSSPATSCAFPNAELCLSEEQICQ